MTAPQALGNKTDDAAWIVDDSESEQESFVVKPVSFIRHRPSAQRDRQSRL